MVPNRELANTDGLANDESLGNYLVTRLDGKVNKSAPRYIAIASSFDKKAKCLRGSDLVVQISDLGSGKALCKSWYYDKTSLTIG